MSLTVPDRRQARRAATLDELVDVAIQVMAEHGAAGLSLGEVARRMGMRPPSLYVYVDSKNAVYDLVFAQGWRAVLDIVAALPEPGPGTDVTAYLTHSAEVYLRWSVEHPVHAALMGWRQVPGYEPSEAAYEPAVAALGRLRQGLLDLQQLGAFRADVELEEVVAAWTVLMSGVVSQQLANQPGRSFDDGTYTQLLPSLIAMFVAHYAPAGRTRRTSRTKEKP
jgi:AcrR family transcriptional regulator